MKIAVEGCAHGELDKIYEAIHHLESKEGIKVDLLICCGDFQSTRNVQDLRCMAVPQKYQNMCSFYKYYSGEKIAPVLTLFIGGNHEASNYLQELAYGGWVAPKIYYMGYASIVNIAGVRIAGLSGIYKGHDYLKGHFEKPPYSENTKRSVYHIRNLEIFRLKQVQQPVDIFLSHDWPRGIYNHGDVDQLLKYKPFFSKEIESNTLGSKPCEELLHHMKPKYWFAAHLHVKFAAIVEHPSDNENNKQTTKFLALDKCLPRRRFLQVVEIPHDTNKPLELEYDLEWLTVVHLTNHLLSIKKTMQYMPGPGLDCRWEFTPTKEELELIRQKFNGDLRVPENFTQTVTPFEPGSSSDSSESTPSKNHQNRYPYTQQPTAQLNPQTMSFCERLGISDPMALLINYNGNDSSLDSSQISSCDTLPSFLTPERSGNITQVSLDESSELTLEESIEMELSTKPKSRSANTSLLLPSPLNSDVDEGGRESSPENEVRRRISLSPKDSDDAEERSFLGNDGSQQSSSSGVVSTNELPTDSEAAGETNAGPEPRVKKFKRRNQSLYSSAEEDG